MAIVARSRKCRTLAIMNACADTRSQGGAMLEINPETVCFIIGKAKEFHAKEAVVIPDEPLRPSEDWARQVLADHLDDPVYQEVAAAIEDLEPDQQAARGAGGGRGRGGGAGGGGGAAGE